MKPWRDSASPTLSLRFFAAVVLVLGSNAQEAWAVVSDYDVTINTAALAGDGGTLAFDFVSGGAFSNSVTISEFSTSGTLGSNGPNSGSVTGALPATMSISDGSFFNEYLQGLTFGSKITFELTATTTGPTGGALPDTFSFFILNQTATSSLLTTTDPTSANSLFTLQIDGSSGGNVGNYSSSPSVTATLVPVTSSVPEPDSVGLLVLGALCAGLAASRKTG